ncbi:Fic family protein [Actinotalea subterranea]|uniref:Fic family protein n=1 Tax=Actinotalea subterranea TaxID=2607497 RepID=UPI0011EDE298|nr:Fic family protein [Actinotalea subterranea]
MPGHPLAPLTDLPGVADAVAQARTACEELRWHRALRRQWAVARTESGIRSARAGLEIDGLRRPLDLVRDVARGAVRAPEGPDGDAVVGALRAEAHVEQLMAAPGATGTAGVVPFAQLLARVHAAVVGPAGPTRRAPRAGARTDAVGRPRSAHQPLDLRGLGAAPEGAELAARLASLADLVALPLPASVPALVLAAVVHGELLTLRPFERGNGAVARAVLRHQLTQGGVDPVGVVVPAAAWAAEPMLYLSTAAGYATGRPERVAAWLRYCAHAVVAGAEEGRAVADAVLAGRLGDGVAEGEVDGPGDGAADGAAGGPGDRT